MADAKKPDIEVPDTPMAKGLRSLVLLAGVTSSLVPNLDFFRSHSPPLFAASSLLTSGLAMVLLYFGWTRRFGRPVLVAFGSALMGVALISGYGVAYEYLTVAPPRQGDEPARQIGFHMARWSLTTNALRLVDADDDELEVDTPQTLMLAMGGWEDGKIPTIWKSWTIVSAGVLLIVLFSAGFMAWTFAFGVLARFVAGSDAARAPPAPPETGSAGGAAADGQASSEGAPVDGPKDPEPPAPAVASGARARIVRLLPRPPSDPRHKEAATIRNLTSEVLPLTGWTLCNGQGKAWKLDELGALAPGAEGTIFRNGQPMSLRDSGDTIQLRDEAGTVQHELRYGKVAVDEVVGPDS